MGLKTPPIKSFLSTTAGIGLSQLGSSASNLLLILAIARQGTPTAVGETALALACYQLALGATRALVGEVVLVRRELLGDVSATSALGVSLIVGGTTGSLMVISGLATGLNAVSILGCFFPLLAVQDTCRYISFSSRRVWRAALSDLLWAGSSATLAFVTIVPELDGPTAVLWWAVSGSVATIVFAARGQMTDPFQPVKWFRRSWMISRAYLLDFALAMVISILPTFSVAAIGGLGEAGAFRFTLAFFGPITVAWAALVNSFTPLIASRKTASITTEVALAAMSACSVLVWGLLGMVTPQQIGISVAGDSWTSARNWLPWTTLALLAGSAGGSAVLGLRARGLGAVATKARLLAAPFGLTFPSLGYFWWGAVGYGYGAAISGVGLSCVLWIAFVKSMDRGNFE